MDIRYLHFLLGPNRHSNTTLMELLLVFEVSELSRIEAARSGLGRSVRSCLADRGADTVAGELPDPGSADNPMGLLGAWVAALGLALQRSAGHRVGESGVLVDQKRRRATVLFEHEESQVGERAGQLAIEILEACLPEMHWPEPRWARPGTLAERYAQFADFARALVMPVDTQAIIDAAGRRGVPVVKLERDPYEPIQGGFRVRMNSMLMLGHCGARQVLDGTFAIERPGKAAALLSDPRAVARAMAWLQLPGAGQGWAGPTEGGSYRIIVANHRVVGVFDEEGARPWQGELHPDWQRLASRASRSLEVGLLAITVATPDPAASPTTPGARVTGLNVAPELDRFLPADWPLLAAAMDGFLQWLFPDPASARVPIVAVTGTNGKTTTSRMVARILQASGRVTGLVCTDGRYVDGQQLAAGDEASLMGHYRVFETREIEAAVLETHHRGIAVYGFAFEKCDVAACTNVSNDHIGEYGLDSVAEMAVLKRALLERASTGVVLNAEDPHCLAMLPHLGGSRVCLTASATPLDELAARHPAVDCFCSVESRDGTPWLVLHDAGQELPVIALADIPATFAGSARHNVENALTAAASAYLAGIAPDTIRQALGEFRMDLDATPGRLNEFAGLPYRVIMDNAHNTDGMRRLAEFTDSLDCDGVRHLLLAAHGDRRAADVALMARAAAGHFDRYYCRDYPKVRGDRPGHVPGLLAMEFEAAGVPRTAIQVLQDPRASIGIVLEMARPGDLVVLAVSKDEFARVRAQIESLIAGCALSPR